MSCQNQSASSSNCSINSVGAGNQLFASLIQTFLTTQCALSSPNLWPRDYGKYVLEHGELFIFRNSENEIIFQSRRMYKVLNSRLKVAQNLILAK